MRKVLCFSYLERHLKKLLPVIKRLEYDGKVSVVTVIINGAEKEIAIKHNINYMMLDEFSDDNRNVSYDTKFEDLQWGLLPLINCLRTLKPDLFLAMEVNYILRNAIHYCKVNHISNIIVQHGVPNKLSLHAFAPFEGDVFLSWGDFSKDFLINNHVDPAKIVLTGGCNFDHLADIKPDRNKYAELIGCNPSKKWIVFTTQGLGVGDRPTAQELHDAFLETAKAATESSEYELIYQAHPSQDIDYIYDVINEIEHKNCYVGRWGNTEELIACADGMITFFSTTAIDCVLLGVPLMLVNLEDEHNFLPFADMGAAISATCKEDIQSCIYNLLYPSKKIQLKQKEVSEYFNYKNDHYALDRIIEYIYSLFGR
ncbi:hypothetical protein FYJ84_03695 [Veillonellaceae bacterium WCA-693-APC-5D-A]|uniref:UDP-N-acetylglucosamine 2-epimerase domain-containing protein n=1 Tax=Anaerovibrio slackiae TaxID=2652309 RepID=A0A6I2UE25_9FIRM|nr:hypothetical protein [Anaerovibrio slackiae]MSU08095.1 hypothetical protein [Anaerovibrio slackiae]